MLHLNFGNPRRDALRTPHGLFAILGINSFGLPPSLGQRNISAQMLVPLVFAEVEPVQVLADFPKLGVPARKGF